MTNHDLKKIAAYIHIPFCEQICFYCDFNKFFLKGQPVDDYIQGLLKEISLTMKKYPRTLETLYIGGGTPTALSAHQLDVFLTGINELFPEKLQEFTVEANPGDLSEDKMKVLLDHKVDRISLGVQTFDNELLKKIGRSHNREDIFTTMKRLDKVGFHNVSIDLIYALPGQSMDNFSATLNDALSLDLPHYSLYSLILENKTYFMNWVRQGHLVLPSDDVAADMFDLAKERLEKNNIFQYEISNFSKAGFQSQHNLMYWNNEHYFGFGAGASGYLGNKRYKNLGPVPHYLNALNNEQLPLLEEETLSKKNQMEEEMFLGLRKKEGVSLSHFEEKFQVSYEEVFGTVTKKLLNDGLVELKNNRLFLTRKSLLLGNLVFEEFLL